MRAIPTRIALSATAALLLVTGTVTPAVAVTDTKAELVQALDRDYQQVHDALYRDRSRGNPHASRGGAPRWGDSDDSVWRRSPAWVRVFARCVRHHESVNAGHYQARNPYSSAAGGYQMLSSTYRALARSAGVPYRGSADRAPAFEQDRIFVWAVMHGQASHWRGTHCGHGT